MNAVVQNIMDRLGALPEKTTGNRESKGVGFADTLLEHLQQMEGLILSEVEEADADPNVLLDLLPPQLPVMPEVAKEPEAQAEASAIQPAVSVEAPGMIPEVPVTEQPDPEAVADLLPPSMTDEEQTPVRQGVTPIPVKRTASVSEKHVIPEQAARRLAETPAPEKAAAPSAVAARFDTIPVPNAGDSSATSVAGAAGEEQILDAESAPRTEAGVSQTTVDPLSMGLPTASAGTGTPVPIVSGPDAVQSANGLPAVDVPDLMEQTVSAIQITGQGARQELRVRLYPDRFGEIHIRLSGEGEQMTVQIQAETQETRQMLESQLQQLQQTLNARQVPCSRVDVTELPLQNSAFAEHQGAPHQFEQHTAQQQGYRDDASQAADVPAEHAHRVPGNHLLDQLA